MEGDSAPAVDYEALLKAIGVAHVKVVDPWDLEATESAIVAGLEHQGPAVIIARRHCRLLPEEKAAARETFHVEVDECIHCELCFESGCPALVWEDDYPYILEWECAGCSMCAQMCPVEAIVTSEGH